MDCVVDCVHQQTDHNYLVLVAALVCLLGSALSVRLLKRTLEARPSQKAIRLVLTAFIAGSTVWSTHFIAMLSANQDVETGYEPLLTAATLVIAIVGMGVSFSVATNARIPGKIVISGVLFGLTICLMHYVGMMAYLIPGHLIWDPVLIAASIALGTSFGVATLQHISNYRYSRAWWISAILMVTAICSMHFIGMEAVTIAHDNSVSVPDNLIPVGMLGGIVFAIISIFLVVGLASLLIETDIEQETDLKLRRAAHHDGLTGLPNRLSLNNWVEMLHDRLRTDETFHVAMLTIDLDMFKGINDLHGHAAGDMVLETLAVRMESTLDEDEFLARIGGDEFVAVKINFRRIHEVQAFAERLRGQILEPVVGKQANFSVGASIGIATNLEDGNDPDELLRFSDLAMYHAKTSEGGKISFYREDMDRQSRDRLVMIDQLRSAVKNEEFELVYQLQNDLKTLEPIGFEVLLRWNHPERGVVSPGEFIPLAEETGLIREIGHWVLRTACIEAGTWKTPYSVAVNVAPQQLVQPSFIENVSDVLIESGLEPDRLELEITEDSIIDDQKNTLRVMYKLKEMGIRIAMDDFGTGYSSLATLQAFPFDKIKIDRSFVQDVHKDRQRAAIVRSTLLLGDALEIPVLAEGVEELEELTFLQSEECSLVQGFYFGRPMCLADARLIAHAPRKESDAA